MHLRHGQVSDPLIIFKGLSIQQQWIPIAIEWLREVFLPLTAPSDPSEWRLLVIDGHHTHTTVDFMWECFSNKVYIVFLPAGTSHILQPLDVAVFGPLKTAFKKHLDRQGGHDSSTIVAKQRFLYCYHKARIETLTESNIRSGWRATGLWPVSKHRAIGTHFNSKRTGSTRRSHWKRPYPREAATISALIGASVGLVGPFSGLPDDRKSCETWWPSTLGRNTGVPRNDSCSEKIERIGM